MKKIYTFAALLISGVIGLSGGAQVVAQGFGSNVDDLQQTESTLSNTCISPASTAVIVSNPNPHDTTNTTSPDYMISYQGGSSTLISTDASISPTISDTPRTSTTDGTFSLQDTANIRLTTDTLAYATKSYSPSVTNTDVTTSYQDTISYSLDTDTSSYPSLSVSSVTYSAYPAISYQVNKPIISGTASVENTNNCTALTNPNTQYPYANITINDAGIAYVAYDGGVTLNWESYGMTDCTVDPISESGTSGRYELKNITSNITVTLNCEVSSDYQDSTVYPSSVEIKVLPPAFEYLKNYLSQIQPSGNKKVNLNSISNFLDQAQKTKKADLAQSFLQKSVDNLKQQAAKGVIPSSQVTKYENAANYLSKTLPVKVVMAADGCSVTATGPAGLIVQYGANESMRRGYGDEVTIPASGTITATIYAPNGWQSTAEVVDSTGLIYARDTKDVTTDDCPEPPVVYDPSTYNGYPEKWAIPEVGTVVDDWGYLNKTAESYVAFRITDSGRTFPTGYGNASDWLAKATNDGYVVDYPQAGDIAINTLDISFGGPIAWHVDSVDASGNYQTSAIRSDGNMNWSSGTVSGSSYLKYIRIP